MLNYNKIESAINSAKLSTRTLGDILGIPEATYRDRIKKKNLSPDDVEKISDYFNKPISYFFDREDQPDIIVEPPAEYHRKCLLCEEKDRKIIELQVQNHLRHKDISDTQAYVIRHFGQRNKKVLDHFPDPYQHQKAPLNT